MGENSRQASHDASHYSYVLDILPILGVLTQISSVRWFTRGAAEGKQSSGVHVHVYTPTRAHKNGRLE